MYIYIILLLSLLLLLLLLLCIYIYNIMYIYIHNNFWPIPIFSLVGHLWSPPVGSTQFSCSDRTWKRDTQHTRTASKREKHCRNGRNPNPMFVQFWIFPVDLCAVQSKWVCLPISTVVFASENKSCFTWYEVYDPEPKLNDRELGTIKLPYNHGKTTIGPKKAPWKSL